MIPPKITLDYRKASALEHFYARSVRRHANIVKALFFSLGCMMASLCTFLPIAFIFDGIEASPVIVITVILIAVIGAAIGLFITTISVARKLTLAQTVSKVSGPLRRKEVSPTTRTREVEPHIVTTSLAIC